jgi:hypothetical protein
MKMSNILTKNHLKFSYHLWDKINNKRHKFLKNNNKNPKNPKKLPKINKMKLKMTIKK